MIKQKKKVIIAMSGGVDSSVAAWFLKKHTYLVEGLFMKNWEENDKEGYCHSEKDLSDAENVCKKLNIYLHKINFSQEYWEQVFKHFLKEHKKGNTPNPDILCNKEIKFKLFFNYAIKQLQADYIATGHYARICKKNGIHYLLKGIDCNKDQSYFLYTLKADQLEKILFPIGSFKKTQIRIIAKKIGLTVAEKKDSTGICFIGPKNINSFLSYYMTEKKGNIITTNGEIIGKHNGLFYYTLGQRKGLKIGGIQGKDDMPWYVVEKNIKTNSLIVAQGSNNLHLMSKGLIAEKIDWINNIKFKFPFFCKAKIRYRQNDLSCKIKYIDNFYIKVLFDVPVVAVTPGQSVVFYLSDICIGGGVIKYKLPLL
ncbi:tRNA 2-thiouridine(34) synthase MnmA [Buchnera aphidicola (Aphis fabae)]|uniref:tRNA-specific 2-thiouridylase MnmA n=1 Tax=Buchnera aphidicola (Aphis fabae) TaxID=571430 RepID=A0A5J6ZCL9_9GAMM|nr:tRNA 2-thiouridine(34) synthase MnmA [Buchnera aphidicola]QFQ32438.1 tRNA 2-thiouridine(34) synthase MnmA [Buchnera aphidicola (Aphis fabae)]